MYCKYCGSRIASDTTKCVSCGANIDLNDGGQSFFDDNELNAWQSDSISYNAQSSVPRTEMREPLPEKANFEEEYEKTFARPQASVSTRGNSSHARSKKKKNVLDYLNLSSSNKLIIFCIASALAIVLLVVAIIAVLNSGDDTTDENATQNNASGYSTTVNNNSEQNNQHDNPTTETRQNETDPKNEEDIVKNMTEVKDIKILDKDKKEISHSVSAFMDGNNTLYVSVDRILKHEGYESGVPNGNNPNRIIYDNKKSGKKIEVEKQTNKIWVSEKGESPQIKYIDANNFNVKKDTYIPIVSFLREIGYDKDKIKWDIENKTLYFIK